MTKTVDITTALKLNAAPTSKSVLAAVARGAVLSHDRNLLIDNGGHLNFSDDWERRIIYKVTKDEKKMVSRLGNTAAMPIAPAIFSETKLDFQR